MLLLRDNSPMPSGKYRGTKMEDVPAEHLIYIYDNDLCSDDVSDYIEDCIEVLNMEINEGN